MHKFRAKTNNLIIILSVLLVAVFAFTIGQTFANLTLTLNVGSNPNSTTTYLAKQEYAVINDSINSPIIFGDGAKLSEVAIEYSYSYDIDIRISYSLSWSNGASTDNVILTMPNRDNFIVDDDYIFVRDSISAGTGKLTIISAVNFANTTDETYIGANLTINIDDVEIYIASDDSSSYNSTHALAQGISGEAVTAWLKYKNPSIDSLNSSNAYVIAYNYRYNYDNGVIHPGANTAYYLDCTNYRLLYGNRFYAGVGLYIVTGSSPIKLTVGAVGLWRTATNTNASGDTLVFENNLKYNFDDNWTYDSAINNVFDNMYYNYIIPANSAVYVNVIDSIEITTIGSLQNSDYSNYRMVTNLIVNDVDFITFSNGIASGYIASKDNGATTNYQQENIVVTNSGEYSPYLYNLTIASGTTDILTSVLLTNNTSSKLSVTLTTRLNAVISNGRTQKGEGNIDFSNSNYWARKEFNSSAYSAEPKSYGTYIAPYSTIDLYEAYQIGASFFDELATQSGGVYDAWVYLEVSVNSSSQTSSSSTNNSLDVIATMSNSSNSSTIELFVKNNTDSKVTNIQTTLSLTRQQTTYSQLTSSTAPADWRHFYWQYYIYSNGSFIANTNPDFLSTQTYYIKNVDYPLISLSNNYTTFNGFSLSSGNNFRSSSLSLMPGESAKVMEISLAYSLENIDLSQSSASGSTATSLNTIEIVNEGTANAFIVNNSTNSYYVRFLGTLNTTNTKFETIGNYNYFVGIVRPGQVISVSMSAGENLTLSLILATDEFDDNLIQTMTSSWGESATQIFENYFAIK